jgi:hypothetical protein
MFLVAVSTARLNLAVLNSFEEKETPKFLSFAPLSSPLN